MRKNDHRSCEVWQIYLTRFPRRQRLTSVCTFLHNFLTISHLQNIRSTFNIRYFEVTRTLTEVNFNIWLQHWSTTKEYFSYVSSCQLSGLDSECFHQDDGEKMFGVLHRFLTLLNIPDSTLFEVQSAAPHIHITVALSRIICSETTNN